MATRKRTGTILVRMPPDDYVRLKSRAEAENRSMANLAEYLIQQGMVAWEEPKEDRNA